LKQQATSSANALSTTALEMWKWLVENVFWSVYRTGLTVNTEQWQSNYKSIICWL